MNQRTTNDDLASAVADDLLATNPEAWLAAIVDSSDDAIVGKTLDSVIRSWNAGATRVFGWTAEEAIGKPVYILIPPERHYEEPEIIGRLVRGDRVDHYETIRLHKDGTRLDVSLSISPIRDKTGRIIGAAKIARDISESKRLQKAERELAAQLQELATELEQQVDEGQSLQEELEQTNEELTRALTEAEDARRAAEEANAAKSQFLATMSHELRTPLNAIAGYVSLLTMGIRGPLTGEQEQDLGRIKRSEETLLRLVEDVLSFAKLESGRLHYHYEEVPLNDVLATLEPFVAPRLAEKHLLYEFERCGPDVVATIDRDKVEQIMLNLLSNAVKFTDQGRIHVRCRGDDGTVRIEVRDTGRGIRADLLDKIFEPFMQVDHSLTRTAEGTGLGLSISRQLARDMGGDIQVESTLGNGSVFALVLPRHRDPERDAREAERRTH
jgi:two-component system, sensor histidine kinase and response regulator